jgi:uncharacterized membrane protein YqhA
VVINCYFVVVILEKKKGINVVLSLLATVVMISGVFLLYHSFSFERYSNEQEFWRKVFEIPFG